MCYTIIQGLYRNPVTGTSMPIPEAMNRGLILVEFTNKSVEAGELIRRGIITVSTNVETITYSVQVSICQVISSL